MTSTRSPRGDDAPQAAGQADCARSEPVDHVFDRWLKVGGRILWRLKWTLVAIPAIMAGIVPIHRYKDELPEPWWWSALAIVFLVFLASLISEVIPEWKRLRRTRWIGDRRLRGPASAGYFRVGPCDETDSETFHRADGKHEEVLHWLAANPEPLLYLTGSSGAGKTRSLTPTWSLDCTRAPQPRGAARRLLK